MQPIILPLLVAIIGAVVYVLTANPKLAVLAEKAYFAGILVTLAVFATTNVRLFS